MSSSKPLRRSRRGEQHTFAPGDKVEIVRTSGVQIGTLRYKVGASDDDEQHPSTYNHHPTIRWVVSVRNEDTESSEEEEVSEKYIARLVEASSNESDSVKSSSSKSSKSKKTKVVPASTKRTLRKNGRFQRNDDLPPPPPPSKPSNLTETVVKVKMLTGTLYLYRGTKPRAEFIRSV